MNLQPVAPIPEDPLKRGRVRCVRCGVWESVENAYADLDGTAYVDYYCTACAHHSGGIAHCEVSP